MKKKIFYDHLNGSSDPQFIFRPRKPLWQNLWILNVGLRHASTEDDAVGTLTLKPFLSYSLHLKPTLRL